MPVLHTARLDIRTVREDDLDPCARLFDDIQWSDPARSAAENRARRKSWIAWAIDSDREFARLHQPPLGERAVVERASGAFIGMVGFVPSLFPFEALPWFGAASRARRSFDMGLFWAISPARQRQGFASEAAGAMIDYAFGVLRLARVIATTEHDNADSIAVMRRLGMTVEGNPQPDPHFQTVGWLEAGDRP